MRLQPVLRTHLPEFEPIFVNLPELSGAQLATGGAFGQVLRVVQSRKERRAAFAGVLGEVVGRLEAVSRTERPRWIDLLNYLDQLVYHSRGEAEREPMWGLIRDSLRSQEDRLEIDMVRKTAFEADRERFQAEGKRLQAAATLLRQLRLRFGVIPHGVEQAVEGTRDLALIERWLDQFASASSLSDVGIGG